MLRAQLRSTTSAIAARGSAHTHACAMATLLLLPCTAVVNAGLTRLCIAGYTRDQREPTADVTEDAALCSLFQLPLRSPIQNHALPATSWLAKHKRTLIGRKAASELPHKGGAATLHQKLCSGHFELENATAGAKPTGKYRPTKRTAVRVPFIFARAHNGVHIAVHMRRTHRALKGSGGGGVTAHDPRPSVQAGG